MDEGPVPAPAMLRPGVARCRSMTSLICCSVSAWLSSAVTATGFACRLSEAFRAVTAMSRRPPPSSAVVSCATACAENMAQSESVAVDSNKPLLRILVSLSYLLEGILLLLTASFRLEDAIAFLIWPASWLHPARTNNEASVAHGNEERDYCRRCSCPIINESCSQLSAESRSKIGVSINVNDLSDRTIDVHAFIPPAARTAQSVDSPSKSEKSELQSLMRTSYAVFCLKTKTQQI